MKIWKPNEKREKKKGRKIVREEDREKEDIKNMKIWKQNEKRKKGKERHK